MHNVDKHALTCLKGGTAAGGGPDSDVIDFGAENAKLGASVAVLMAMDAVVVLKDKAWVVAHVAAV